MSEHDARTEDDRYTEKVRRGLALMRQWAEQDRRTREVAA